MAIPGILGGFNEQRAAGTNYLSALDQMRRAQITQQLEAQRQQAQQSQFGQELAQRQAQAQQTAELERARMAAQQQQFGQEYGLRAQEQGIRGGEFGLKQQEAARTAQGRNALQGLLSQGGEIDTAALGRAVLPYDTGTGIGLIKAAKEEQAQKALMQRTGGTGVSAPANYRWTASGDLEAIPGGEKDPEVQARLEAIKQGGKTGPGGTVAFEQENKLRDEFYKQAEPFVKIRDAHARVMASAQEPSGAGDLSLLYNYMKMLDPGSTVMAGEYAQAANAGGIPERIRAQYNKAISGEKLDPNMRADFVDRSNRLLKEQEKSFQNTSERYTKLTERYGLRPENVVGDLNIKQSPGAQANWQSQYQSKAQAVQGAMEAITRGVPRQVVIDRLREIGITDARI